MTHPVRMRKVRKVLKMSYLDYYLIKTVVEDAIINRKTLSMVYQKVGEEVPENYLVAPFDIGPTNPRTSKRYANTLFAFSFHHMEEGRTVPKVCAFSLDSIVSVSDADEAFDPARLAEIHRANSGYDYSACQFALVPNRNWFGL